MKYKSYLAEMTGKQPAGEKIHHKRSYNYFQFAEDFFFLSFASSSSSFGMFFFSVRMNDSGKSASGKEATIILEVGTNLLWC